MRTRTRAAVGVTAVALALAGCQSVTEPFSDAPVERKDDSPAVVMSFPDGFSNVSSKCDGPNRVYVVYHGAGAYGSVAVVADDPRCSR